MATSDFDARPVAPANIADLVRMSDALMLPTAHDRRGLDLHHIYVAPDWRGRGVRRPMIPPVEDHAKSLGCTYVTIGTD
ncbi:GNAT family N-acetyltransferase [Loktanella sp. M215]|uniref:GNAT family N-acetyltransferase n=1 Tax=Loktanella sp. M215 TaxID=2675431 RepID=UPI001F2B3EF8|nr:GNAT family N-acetyltransferase [Loktanella sp. M215]MCF7700103.1 hypothetical protein [Loktanella sp. M215]